MYNFVMPFLVYKNISREKLYEELLMKEEGLQDTLNHLIHIGKPIEMDEEVFLEKLVHLKKEAYDETNDIRHLIKDIVPTYQPKSKQNVCFFYMKKKGKNYE